MQFIQTPWASLSDFLYAGKCDFAWGGIGYTEQRAAAFHIVTVPIGYFVIHGPLQILDFTLGPNTGGVDCCQPAR